MEPSNLVGKKGAATGLVCTERLEDALEHREERLPRQVHQSFQLQQVHFVLLKAQLLRLID